jgi:hypothetical protein
VTLTEEPLLDLPYFQFLRGLEGDLRLPKGFFERLLAEDDWSFIVKLHALIEASVTHLLVHALNRSELQSYVGRLELSNLQTGKLGIAKALDLLDSDQRRFIQHLSQLRNDFVHEVENVQSTIEDFLNKQPQGDRKGYDRAFRWGWRTAEDIKYKIEEGEKQGLYHLPRFMQLMAVKAYEHLPKFAIWIGAMLILRHIQLNVEMKRLKAEEEELFRNIAKALLSDEQ